MGVNYSMGHNSFDFLFANSLPLYGGGAEKLTSDNREVALFYCKHCDFKPLDFVDAKSRRFAKYGIK